MVLCRVLVGDKRYCAYVLIYDKFEPFERFEPLLGPFERFERYMSTSLYGEQINNKQGEPNNSSTTNSVVVLTCTENPVSSV